MMDTRDNVISEIGRLDEEIDDGVILDEDFVRRLSIDVHRRPHKVSLDGHVYICWMVLSYDGTVYAIARPE